MNKCSIDGCPNDAVLHVMGTDNRLCKAHAALKLKTKKLKLIYGDVDYGDDEDFKFNGGVLFLKETRTVVDGNLITTDNIYSNGSLYVTGEIRTSGSIEVAGGLSAGRSIIVKGHIKSKSIDAGANLGEGKLESGDYISAQQIFAWDGIRAKNRITASGGRWHCWLRHWWQYPPGSIVSNNGVVRSNRIRASKVICANKIVGNVIDGKVVIYPAEEKKEEIVDMREAKK